MLILVIKGLSIWRGREGLIKLHSLRGVKATCNYMYHREKLDRERDFTET